MVFIGVGIAIVALIFVFIFFKKPNQELFQSPGRTWNSPKKVENYFVETMHMSSAEAKAVRLRSDGKVNMRTGADTTIQGLVGNLVYYGFVRDEKSFLYALEQTQDTTPSDKAMTVGKNGTIDRNAEYRISEDMSAWEIADILLNKPSGHFTYDEYNYFLMP